MSNPLNGSMYTYKTVMVVPFQYKDAANQLMLVLGLSSADVRTFKDTANFTKDGTDYCVSAPLVTDRFVERVQNGELETPPHLVEAEANGEIVIDHDLVALAYSRIITSGQPTTNNILIRHIKIEKYEDYRQAYNFITNNLGLIPIADIEVPE